MDTVTIVIDYTCHMTELIIHWSSRSPRIGYTENTQIPLTLSDYLAGTNLYEYRIFVNIDIIWSKVIIAIASLGLSWVDK